MYEDYKKGMIIFQENDSSNDKFYIILSGVINILTQKKENVFIDENKEENQKLVERIITRKQTIATPTQKNKFSLFTPFIENSITTTPLILKKKDSTVTLASNITKTRKKMNFNLEEVLKRSSGDQESENFDDRIKEFGFVLNSLTEGESFGEKALLGEAGKRTATVVAQTDVELLIIKKRNFLEITQKFNMEKEKKKKFLMSTLPYLKTIHSMNTLENLLYCFKEENLIFGFSVTEEDSIDSEEKIYFLLEGTCKVERNFIQVENNSIQVTSCQITEVSDGSIIGEEILFEQESFYKYTVIVTYYNFLIIFLFSFSLNI